MNSQKASFCIREVLLVLKKESLRHDDIEQNLVPCL